MSAEQNFAYIWVRTRAPNQNKSIEIFLFIIVITMRTSID